MRSRETLPAYRRDAPTGPDRPAGSQFLRTNDRANDRNCRGAAKCALGHTRCMQESLLSELRARRLPIHMRWEALLRAEPIATPLGHPDTLIHLIEPTLDELFHALEESSHSRDAAKLRIPSDTAACTCGRNPLLAFFAAARQATLEGLVLAQAASGNLDPHERDSSLADLNQALQRISGREIEAFCGVCQFRRLALPAAMELLAIEGR